MNKKTTITVNVDLGKHIRHIKNKEDFPTLDSVIRELFERVEIPVPKQEPSPEPSSSAEGLTFTINKKEVQE